MKMQWTWVFVLAVVPLCATTSKTKYSLAATPLQLGDKIKKPPDVQLSHGKVGGTSLLSQNPVGKKDIPYRPFDQRFKQKPAVVGSPKFLKPENRASYRQFTIANPRGPLGHTGKEQNAEVTVILVFGLTAFAAVICGVVGIYGMQVLDMDSMDMASYQKVMIRIMALAALPWFMLGLWLLTVFARGYANPMGDPQLPYHWQCGAMTWFLLVAPVVNTVFFGMHALWMTKCFCSVEAQPAGSLGRMFTPKLMSDAAGSDKLSIALGIATGSPCRYSMVLIQVFCAGFGYLLLSFRLGANSQLCRAEVYWSTAALVATAAITIVFALLAFLSTVVLGANSASPWLQDFMSSFRDSSALDSMKRREEKEAAGWKAQSRQRSSLEDEALAHFDWKTFDSDFAEEREWHEADKAAQGEYRQAVSDSPPRNPHHLVLPQLATPPRSAYKDELIVWDDDSSDSGSMRDKSGLPPLFLPPVVVTTLPPASPVVLPPIILTTPAASP